MTRIRTKNPPKTVVVQWIHALRLKARVTIPEVTHSECTELANLLEDLTR